MARPLAFATACGLIAAAPLFAQPASHAAMRSGSFRDLSAAIEVLSQQVSASVVQVVVTGYGPDDDRGPGASVVLTRERVLGAGAIIDPDGYIITAAHLVDGAERVQVVVNDPHEAAPPSFTTVTGRTKDAQVIGTATDFDVALLKIDAKGLPALRLADYDTVRQGELVFAFGSPAGLSNSVTMGIVSARVRQPDPAQPTVYLQTDAPINPGNSGGPLVDVEGRLVGIAASIASASGGSQGIGFAIPSAIIAAVYPQLRQFGRLQRGMVGIDVQALTPAMADGLGLTRSAGVVVSDVLPDAPADIAGVQVADVVTTIDGRPIDSVPLFVLEMDKHGAGDVVTFGLLRGSHALSAAVHVSRSEPTLDQLANLADPAGHTIQKLGIVGVDVTPSMAAIVPGLRTTSGVLMTARLHTLKIGDVPLVAGDVIHAVNGITVRSLDGLQVLLSGLKRDSPIVLQIERLGHLMFRTVQFY